MWDDQLPKTLTDSTDELLQGAEALLKQLEEAIAWAASNSAALVELRLAQDWLVKNVAAYLEAKIALAHQVERAREALSKSQ